MKPIRDRDGQRPMNNDNTSRMLARRGRSAGLGTATVGVASVNVALGDEKNAATQVTDRSSSIHITAMKTYWVGGLQIV